jgi:hypothetical protein
MIFQNICISQHPYMVSEFRRPQHELLPIGNVFMIILCNDSVMNRLVEFN